MPFSEQYGRQVHRLVRTIPYTAEDAFALKGGTAINLFVRDTIRLSLDIDLTHLPIASRPDSLADVDRTMERIGTAAVPSCREPELSRISQAR